MKSLRGRSFEGQKSVDWVVLNVVGATFVGQKSVGNDSLWWVVFLCYIGGVGW